MLCSFPFGLATISNASVEAAAVLRGHANSISAVYAVPRGGGEAVRAYTGDWSGHVCVWDVACLGEGSEEAGSGGVSVTQVCSRPPTGLSLAALVVVIGSEGDGGVCRPTRRALLLMLWV